MAALSNLGDNNQEELGTEENPLDLEFDLAVATFRSGHEKKALKMLQSLAKKGHSLSIWELFNRAINSGDTRGARDIKQLESNVVQLAMLEAVLTEAETGIDVRLYEKAVEFGHAGAAFHLCRHFASIGDYESARIWRARTEEMGILDEEQLQSLGELMSDFETAMTKITIEEANALLNEAELNPSREFLDNLLEKHWPCFTGHGECESCLQIEEYIAEGVLDTGIGLLEKLAMNENSSEVLVRVLEASEAYGESTGTNSRAIAILNFMLDNSAASEILKSTILNPDWWLGQLCTQEVEVLDGTIALLHEMTDLALDGGQEWLTDVEALRLFFIRLSGQLQQSRLTLENKERLTNALDNLAKTLG